MLNFHFVKVILQFALRIPTAHDFASLERANERARMQIVRDFPQTELVAR